MVYTVERIKTGIPGLDKLIQGGFVKGSAILISGGTGAGKTIFCLQYLWEGLKNGEPGIYITLEESSDEIKKDALVFGFDFETYKKKGKFKIIEKNIFEDPDLEFFDIDKLKAKRIVIDSISLLSLIISDQASLRNRLLELIRSLKKRNTTLLLTSERIGDNLSRLGVEEFLVDGVIVLNFTPIGSQAGRSLFIRKMRRTKHSEDIHPIEIRKRGIRVLNI
ncbi:MAG: hypothetical protein J7J15_00850 [Candidatus Aenigmarchaeota archaeon]|nr:hypothetical protein [Candidatus Aenigmarchaeota archaeon]